MTTPSNDNLVSLTFDFDAVSLWIAHGQTSPTPISRGEFGVIGAERLIDLLAAHEIKATWFIPGQTIDTYPDVCRRIADAGHEIGHHGYDHISPVGMSAAQEREQLLRGNDAIEKVSGRNARGYRSPAWDLSPNSVELLLENGFTYDSSMMGHDYRPYLARTGDVVVESAPMQFGPTTTLVELPISWSLDDFPHFEYFRGGGLKDAAGVLDNWLEDFRYMTQQPERGVITYTCHPFVIGRGHRMRMLERLLTQLEENGAEFVTAEQAVGSFQAELT